MSSFSSSYLRVNKRGGIDAEERAVRTVCEDDRIPGPRHENVEVEVLEIRGRPLVEAGKARLRSFPVEQSERLSRHFLRLSRGTALLHVLPGENHIHHGAYGFSLGGSPDGTDDNARSVEPLDVKDYTDGLAAADCCHFASSGARKAPGVSADAAKPTLSRLTGRNVIAKPQEFYLIVPPDYRSLGCLLSDQLIPAVPVWLGASRQACGTTTWTGAPSQRLAERPPSRFSPR